MNKKSIKLAILAIIAFTLGCLLVFFNNYPFWNRITHNPEGVIFIAGSIPEKVMGYENNWTPTRKDTDLGETILTKCTKDENGEVYEKLAQYRRQYFGVGTNYIWINAFIIENAEKYHWKDEVIRSAGGGSNFFNALINIDKQNCEWVRINGPE